MGWWLTFGCQEVCFGFLEKGNGSKVINGSEVIIVFGSAAQLVTLYSNWRRKITTHSVFLPESSQVQKNLADYSPKGWKKSNVTERLSTHTHKDHHGSSKLLSITYLNKYWLSCIFLRCLMLFFISTNSNANIFKSL